MMKKMDKQRFTFKIGNYIHKKSQHTDIRPVSVDQVFIKKQKQ